MGAVGFHWTDEGFIATMSLIPFVLFGKSLHWEAERAQLPDFAPRSLSLERSTPLELQLLR